MVLAIGEDQSECAWYLGEAQTIVVAEVVIGQDQFERVSWLRESTAIALGKNNLNG